MFHRLPDAASPASETLPPASPGLLPIGAVRSIRSGGTSAARCAFSTLGGARGLAEDLLAEQPPVVSRVRVEPTRRQASVALGQRRLDGAPSVGLKTDPGPQLGLEQRIRISGAATSLNR
jgi:hypothetical protein